MPDDIIDGNDVQNGEDELRDIEILRLEELKNDPAVRARRLSQLEDYVKEVEQKLDAGTGLFSFTNCSLIDRNANRDC